MLKHGGILQAIPPIVNKKIMPQNQALQPFSSCHHSTPYKPQSQMVVPDLYYYVSLYYLHNISYDHLYHNIHANNKHRESRTYS